MNDTVEIVQDKKANFLLVVLKGRLDITRAGDFEKEVLNHLTKNPSHVIINLSRVTYLSSSGIRALLAVYRQALSHEKRALLCEAPESVQKVLDVVEVGAMLSYFPREEEARAALVEE